MSKRGSTGFGGDEERYGLQVDNSRNVEDPPQKATAAQLARRKIAQLKKPGARGRSGSPAVMPQTSMNGSNAFAQSQPQQQPQPQPQQLQQHQQASNPFTSTSFGFSFGAQPQAQENGASPFQFGLSVPAPSQQNGASTNGIFGQSQPAAPTFPSFNAGSTQQSTNGFNPSTSSIFSQPPQTNSTPSSFGGFGATQQNGATPATTTSSTFGSFGQTQNGAQNGASALSFGGEQKQKESEASSNVFTGFGAPKKDAEKPTSLFAGFGASQKENEKPSTPSFGSFGAAQQDNTSKPSTLFGQPQTNGDKPSNPFGGFGQKQTESNDKTTSFATTNGDKSAQSQEKESNAAPTSMFGGFGAAKTNGESSTTQAQEPKTPMFGGLGQSQATSKPEQPKTSLFSQPPQANGEKTGLFGSSATPFNMPTSGGSVFDSVPKKDLSNGGKPLFSSADPSQIFREDDGEKANNGVTGGSSNTSGQPRSQSSMFGAPQPSQPASNLFTLGNQTPSMSTYQQDTSMTTPSNDTPKNLFASINQAGTSNTPGPTRSLFDRIDKDDVAKRLGGQADSSESTETPKASSFGAALETPAATKSLFGSTLGASSMFQKSAESTEVEASAPSSPQGWLHRARQATAPRTPAPPAAPPVSSKAPPATAPASRMAPPPSQASSLSTVVSASDNPDPRARKLRELNEGVIAHLNTQDPEKDWTTIFQYYMKAAAKINGTPLPSEATAPIIEPTRAIEAPPAIGNLFSQSTTFGMPTVQTPSAPAPTSIFSKPPSTAPPASKKRSFEQDEQSAAQPPATEKRLKPNEPVSYPKLPENASSTSRLFAAALDKSKSVDTSKSATSTFNPSKSMFSASTSQTPAPKPTTGGFMPTSQTPASKPSTGGFVPTSLPAAGGINFLASFGKAAKDEEEIERKKRKAAEYDSEDDDEEEWEKRDREAQEAKRAKLAEAAKGGSGFSLAAPKEPPKTPAFKFGSGNAASTTPAIPPPKFNGLFGSLSQQSTTNEPGKLALPGSSLFGPASSSVEASRATTPGATSEASTAAEDAGEPSDEPDMAQGDDQNALQPSEQEASEILKEIDNALMRKFAKKEGEEKPSFQTIGQGRVYVLKDKATGKTRVVSRVGLGKLILNFNPQANMTYVVHQKKPNLVICDFLDHINFSPAKFDRFYITTNSVDEAKELARLLTEGRP